jgi:hypothetical protein
VSISAPSSDSGLQVTLLIPPHCDFEVILKGCQQASNGRREIWEIHDYLSNLAHIIFGHNVINIVSLNQGRLEKEESPTEIPI